MGGAPWQPVGLHLNARRPPPPALRILLCSSPTRASMSKKAKTTSSTSPAPIAYHEPKVMAEIGCNHMGDLEIAKELLTLTAWPLARDCSYYSITLFALAMVYINGPKDPISVPPSAFLRPPSPPRAAAAPLGCASSCTPFPFPDAHHRF